MPEQEFKKVWVDRDGDISTEEPTSYEVEDWGPFTEMLLVPTNAQVTLPEPDPLEGLGINAYVAHPTDDGWNPYVKRYGQWWVVDTYSPCKVEADEVRRMIRAHGFKVLFEGVPE